MIIIYFAILSLATRLLILAGYTLHTHQLQTRQGSHKDTWGLLQKSGLFQLRKKATILSLITNKTYIDNNISGRTIQLITNKPHRQNTIIWIDPYNIIYMKLYSSILV
jgi:hypothetical protein